MKTGIQPNTPLKRLYRVEEAASLLSLGRAFTFQQISSGRLKSVKVGRARRVPVEAIDAFIALLETETQKAE